MLGHGACSLILETGTRPLLAQPERQVHRVRHEAGAAVSKMVRCVVIALSLLARPDVRLSGRSGLGIQLAAP